MAGLGLIAWAAQGSPWCLQENPESAAWFNTPL
jgi:hypothetical protein